MPDETSKDDRQRIYFGLSIQNVLSFVGITAAVLATFYGVKGMTDQNAAAIVVQAKELDDMKQRQTRMWERIGELQRTVDRLVGHEEAKKQRAPPER